MQGLGVIAWGLAPMQGGVHMREFKTQRDNDRKQNPKKKKKMELNSLLILLEAAEYLERRDRGNSSSTDNLTAFPPLPVHPVDK